MQTDTSRGQRALLGLSLAIVFGYLVVSSGEPLRLNWGDPWSDANVLSALNYSSKYGFVATSFTDVLDIGPLTSDSYRYTHYPPFAEIFYGCVRKLAGGAPLDIAVYRRFAIVFAGIGLFFFFRWLRSLWGEKLAIWATFFCATNLLWLQFADSMHQAPVLFATGMSALAAVPRWVKTQRGAWVIALGTYLCFLTAYDYYFFLPTVALLSARVLGVPLWSKKMVHLAAIVALSGMLSIATKSGFVIGALGWHGFVDDLHFQFLERATTKFSPDYRLGIFIILLSRWTSYFSPIPFVVAVVLFARLGAKVRSLGPGRAVRDLLFGSEELAGNAASSLLLLVAGLPFIVVFSELAAEQVLPSQVVLPFAAVACAQAAIAVSRARPAPAYAGAALLVGWQLFHLARVPKVFLDRDAASAVRSYLEHNDDSDFVVTNLMADGPIQYFFERHLHGPADRPEHAAAGYANLAQHATSRVFHAVYFEDPGTRFIDKSLWPLLAHRERWSLFGAPYLSRSAALDAISKWDEAVLRGLVENGHEVLHVKGMRVFRMGNHRATLLAEAERTIKEPTRYLDFGQDASNIHKLTGFRQHENYPGVPGFCWAVAHTPKRSVLTRRGLEWRTDIPPTFASELLLRVDPSHDTNVNLLAWSSINDQTLSATIDGTPVLSDYRFPIGQTRQEVSFVIPKELAKADRLTEVVFSFRDVADYGGGVAFATMQIDPARD